MANIATPGLFEEVDQDVRIITSLAAPSPVEGDKIAKRQRDTDHTTCD
jgi:hypothetical protein